MATRTNRWRPDSAKLFRPGRASAALGITAGQAGHTTIHHDDGGGAALGAELGTFRVVTL